jgi:hypothetical protein
MAFQFSPVATMTDSDFDQLHLFLGDKPALHSQGQVNFEAYKTRLSSARSILMNTYSFPASSTNW